MLVIKTLVWQHPALEIMKIHEASNYGKEPSKAKWKLHCSWGQSTSQLCLYLPASHWSPNTLAKSWLQRPVSYSFLTDLWMLAGQHDLPIEISVYIYLSQFGDTNLKRSNSVVYGICTSRISEYREWFQFGCKKIRGVNLFICPESSGKSSTLGQNWFGPEGPVRGCKNGIQLLIQEQLQYIQQKGGNWSILIRTKEIERNSSNLCSWSIYHFCFWLWQHLIQVDGSGGACIHWTSVSRILWRRCWPKYFFL